MSDKMISVVVPAFNEAAQLPHTIGAVLGVLRKTGLRHELIIVDDGSRDETWDQLSRLTEKEPGLRAVKLSRNFGKEAALCAGIDEVRGDACIVMDADLQHPPELIPEMIRLWLLDGFPIVEAIKRSRGEESMSSRWSALLFYRVMHNLSGLDLRSASDFKLLDSRIIAAWKLMKERQPFFRGMTAWLGFPRAKLYFEVPPRENGSSRWSRISLAKLALSAITSFSYLPMQVVTSLGVIFLAAALPLAAQTLYNKFTGIAVSGFTTVILLLLIIGSILMISMGIIGTYIARILDEVRQRPRYLVSDRVETVVSQTETPLSRSAPR